MARPWPRWLWVVLGLDGTGEWWVMHRRIRFAFGALATLGVWVGLGCVGIGG